MILPPTSEISDHHKVNNITMSPTSLLPLDRITGKRIRIWTSFPVKRSA